MDSPSLLVLAFSVKLLPGCSVVSPPTLKPPDGFESMVRGEQRWADLAQARQQAGDLEGTWQALEVLVELRPDDPIVRLLRAMALADRKGREAIEEVERELAILWSQLDLEGSFSFSKFSDDGFEVVLDAALKVDRELGRSLAEAVSAETGLSESLSRKVTKILRESREEGGGK